ncbi:BTB domain and ankyrin repeat protein [Aspergillus clavatus NRRL 1]|uniref:BTB domain and ankyrin repeat protein n=1 Tax=Aspergillus clavatus (strain ATCC 1007 / CBS 513.65 / DSM 816 / NCTC 3887 / NRRL 1 / QM 1276 / 107) TaxID=344612 RepID=A1CEJ9_ASPCL|nr:BTB domain and ankyrin repeat protein [Aspergillus clavatus NRRL 1]EAW11298.1 BTB domain and ankyrin repeat protein [Aspergillus clavatus NRRL 1]
MSSILWDFFLRDDVESFRRYLANASYTSGGQRNSGGGGTASFKVGSPGGLTTSSPIASKSRKLSGTSPGTPTLDRNGATRPGKILSRAELNARDHHGRTLLHLVASSQKPSAIQFAVSFLEAPFLDLYAQDWESGWTALHRALYAGNGTIAQALMARDWSDATDFAKSGNTGHPSGGLIKIKDREGYSPFDVYSATIASRDIKRIISSVVASGPVVLDSEISDVASDAPSLDDQSEDSLVGRSSLKPRTNLSADEVFTFGSNKNLNLGLGDQDDRQFPVRITLTRPEHLVRRFYREFQERQADEGTLNSHEDMNRNADLPILIKSKPIKIQSIAMSKLHTAVLTNDPESNLFLCGFGPGGRLGTGDESTRFNFVCIETGGLAHRKVISVALGQDHTLALTEHGEVFSWGSNKFGQLGYSLPRTQNRDDVPIQTSPRQIFNPFKKEVILGVAASAIHSVVFSTSGLYTFGKNEGQLGLVDSDARSLELQVTPRRVGASLFSAGIQSVSAIDHATVVLLQNHEVWVFSQYGYTKVSFPLDSSSNFIRNSFMATRYDTSVNCIVQVKSGGDTICALSSSGEVFTLRVNRSENPPISASTTNPSKTRNSLSSPVRVWAVKKSHMAVRDVDVGQDGSIIICTASGSAWTKEKRRKAKDGLSKDYKFSRVPGLSRVVGVCSNAFGAYAVAQRECDVTKEQISIDRSTLWEDFLPLSPFASLVSNVTPLQDNFLDMRSVAALKRATMSISDIESHFQPTKPEAPEGMIYLMSSLSQAQIPVHEFVMAGRSSFLRKAFHEFRQAYYFSVPDVLDIEYGPKGQCHVRFKGVDFLTVLNLAFFLYTDSMLDYWHQMRTTTEAALRYRQVRSEIMRIATYLCLPSLERAARLMIEPSKSLKTDMIRAFNDPSFFDSCDVVVELDGATMKAHSQVLCRRCPFFDTLFNGRSSGRWLASRRTDATERIRVDLKHIDQSVFGFVLRYIYTDMEEQLFDEVRSKNLDDFIDLVLDVGFVANELMIDRLSQICQRLLGRFVTTNNMCGLLNSISPCAVKEFKDAALEYICLNLEELLTHRLVPHVQYGLHKGSNILHRYLKELDANMLDALDTICHENQLASFPVSRGRNSEEYMFETYPELITMIQADRRRTIDSMRLQTRLSRLEGQEDRSRPIADEKSAVSPSVQRTKAILKENINLPRSPVLKSRQSTSDLMFQMDDDPLLSPADSVKGKAAVRGTRAAGSNENRPSTNSSALGTSLNDRQFYRNRELPEESFPSLQDNTLSASPSELRAAALQQKQNGYPSSGTSETPWASSAVSTPKKELKDIMTEASEKRVSNLSLGMSARRESSSNSVSKLSQKERKKLQQQQLHEKLVAQQKAKEAVQNPWKVSTPVKTPGNPDSPLCLEAKDTGPSQPAKLGPKPSMTLRQTVAGTPPPRSTPTATPSPHPTRGASSGSQPVARSSTSGPSSAAPAASPASPASLGNAQPAIQSIRHIPRPELYQTSFHSPSPNSLSLAAILMQQQTEKDELREAATAKHNLDDIQLEQQFQEWWDKESRRVQGFPDPATTTTTTTAADQTDSERRGGRGGRGRGPGNRKKRGKVPETAAGASGLTQQLSRVSLENEPKHPAPRRDGQQPKPNGNHMGASGNARRGGRGGHRGKGNPRDQNTQG